MASGYSSAGRTADDINILNLQFVHVERFAFIVKTLMENDLFDEAVKHLQSRGCQMLAISVEPLEIIQEMIRGQSEARAKPGGREALGSEKLRRLDDVQACACSGPKYPPRPPDDWPEGPWDPPRKTQLPQQ